MLSLYDIVRLKEDDAERGVTKANDGVVVDIHSGGEAYTIEFFDDGGETIEDALFTTYTEDELTIVKTFSEMA